MIRKVRIIEAGDTNLLPDALVDIHTFTDANRKVFKERKHPATAKPVLLGITKASLETESFLSAARSRKLTLGLGRKDVLEGKEVSLGCRRIL